MRATTRLLLLTALVAVAMLFGIESTFNAQGAAPAQTPPAQAPPAGQGPGAAQGGNAGGGGGAFGRRGGTLPGAPLYTASCASCHGADPTTPGKARSLFDEAWLDNNGDLAITASVHNAKVHAANGGFTDLTDEQVFDIISFMRTNTSRPLRPRADVNTSPNGTVVKSAKQTFKVELVTEGLMTPWALAFLPDGRMLITERDGRLQVLDKGKLAVVTGTPKAHVQQDGGYLDVEVHPDYARNGWIYLAYVEDQPDYVAPPPAPAPAAAPAPAPAAAPPANGGANAGGGGQARGGGGRGGPPQVPSMTVIVRGKLSKNNEWTDQQTIFRAPTSYYTTSGAHYGMRMLFDRENHLFFTLGERNGNNPNYAQDLTSPLGKVHRVNDDGTVPKDNPFVNTPGDVGSIWTYGHRNPEGLAWDPVTGHLWESEHGPNTADEINVIVKGHNYGWNLVSKQGPPTYKINGPGMDEPAWYFTPTFAPAGISFYTGNRYPAWKNTSLFVGGLAGQALRRLEIKGDAVVSQEIVFDQFGRVRDVVQGPDGYFYIALQDPTGVPNPAGGNISLSASTPGRVIRLLPQ